MCTIISVLNTIEDFPIIIAQNRDQFSNFSEQQPQIIIGKHKVFAPIDERSRGTWLGVNECGLVLALTNHYQKDGCFYEYNKSRGVLVLDILKNSKDVLEAISTVKAETSIKKYKYFNLFCLSKDASYLIVWNGQIKVSKIKQKRIFHHSSGYDAGEIKEIREKRINELFSNFKMDSLESTLQHIEMVCKDHLNQILDEKSICMHGENRRTISSTIFAIQAGGRILCKYLYGLPCESRYDEYNLTLN